MGGKKEKIDTVRSNKKLPIWVGIWLGICVIYLWLTGKKREAKYLTKKDCGATPLGKKAVSPSCYL